MMRWEGVARRRKEDLGMADNSKPVFFRTAFIPGVDDSRFSSYYGRKQNLGAQRPARKKEYQYQIPLSYNNILPHSGVCHVRHAK